MQLSDFNERHCYVNYLKDNPFLFIEAATVVEPGSRNTDISPARWS